VKYLLWINEKGEGPYDKSQIGEMLSSGKITEQTTCLREDGNGDWQSVGTVPGLLDGAVPRPNFRREINITCPHCGHSFLVDELRVGQEVNCPSCNELITIRRPGFLSGLATAASEFKKASREIAEEQEVRLVHCPDCQGIVSRSATACPHCGFTPPEAPRGCVEQVVGYIVLLVGVIFILVLFYSCG
jgi:predicted Zn finger-like uncharacterized protein